MTQWLKRLILSYSPMHGNLVIEILKYTKQPCTSFLHSWCCMKINIRMVIKVVDAPEETLVLTLMIKVTMFPSNDAQGDTWHWTMQTRYFLFCARVLWWQTFLDNWYLSILQHVHLKARAIIVANCNLFNISF